MAKDAESKEPVSFKYVCRTCASKNKAKFNLFAQEKIDNKMMTLKELILMCTEMTISSDDTLPVNVCEKCRNHLIQCYHFNKTVFETQKVLQSEYLKIKSEQNVMPHETVTTKSNEKSGNMNKLNQINILKGSTKLSPKARRNILNECYKEIKILPKSIDKKAKPLVIYDNNLSSNVNLHSSPVIIIPTGSTNNTMPTFLNQETTIKPAKLNLSNSLQPNLVYPCSKCTKQFVSKSYLKTHLEQFHGEIATAVECSLCNIEFGSQEELTEHNLKVHFPSFQPHDKVACNLCKKEYKDRYLLARHKKKAHLTGDSKFSCNSKCGMAFSTHESLVTHQKNDCRAVTSFSKTDVVCKLCKGIFVSDRSLASHMKSHSDNICSYCSKVYAREADLLEHVAEHSDQTRPYSCAYCAKHFSAKKVLVRHQKQSHGISQTVLLCGHCNTVEFGYIGMVEMSQHMQKVHSDIMTVDVKIENAMIPITDEDTELAKVPGNYIITYYVEENTVTDEKQSNDPKTEIIIPEKDDEEEYGEMKRNIIWKEKQQYLHNISWEETLQTDECDDSHIDEIYQDNDIKCGNIDEAISGNENSSHVAQKKNAGRVNICINSDTGKVTYLDSKGDIVDEKNKVDLDLKSKVEGFEIESDPDKMTCKWCGVGFTKVQSLRNHLHQEHGVRFIVDHKASKKPKVKSYKIKLVKNAPVSKIKITDDAKAPYKCNICGKKFQRLVNLEKHSSRHAFGFPCPRCGIDTIDRHSLCAHLKICRDPKAENDKLICPTCGKRLKTSAGWRYHLQTHSNIRRFVCPSCPSRRFLTAANLKAHNRVVHSQIRPHLCVMCGRRFASTNHLRKHIASHAGRRDHLCSICGQGFLQSSHVSQHMWVHTGVKPHRCPFCPNKYTAKCSLTKHLSRNHWEQQRNKRLAEEKMQRKLCGEDVDAVILEHDADDGVDKNKNTTGTSDMSAEDCVSVIEMNLQDDSEGTDNNNKTLSDKFDSIQSNSDQLTLEDVNNVQNASRGRPLIIRNYKKINAPTMPPNSVHNNNYTEHLSLIEIDSRANMNDLSLTEDNNCEGAVEISLKSKYNDDGISLNDENMSMGEEMTEEDFVDGVDVVIVDVNGHIVDGDNSDVIIGIDGTEEYVTQYEQNEESDGENHV